MPAFLVPLHEANNDCHNPGGNPAGGRFCSDGGQAAVAKLAKKYTNSMEGAAEVSRYTSYLIRGTTDDPDKTPEEIKEEQDTADVVMKQVWGHTDKQIAQSRERGRLQTQKDIEKVRPLVEAIRQAPEATMPLYRAIGVSKPYTIGKTVYNAEAKFDNLKVGDTMSLDRVTSFSGEPEIAAQFAATPQSIASGVFDPSGDMHPDDAKDYSNYQIIIEGPHKSLDVAPYSRYGEKERLTHGKFEVVKVENWTATVIKGPKGSGLPNIVVPYKRTITVRQVATY